MIRNLIPYFLVTGLKKNNLKKVLRSFLPYGIVKIIQDRNRKKMFTEEYLRKNYVSDLTESERYLLLSYLKLLEKNKSEVSYLEIGIYSGSTIRFLKERTEKTKFTGIDLFEDFQPGDDNTHIWRNYKMETVWNVLGKDRVTLFKNNSVDTLISLANADTKFDMIFIDGNHTYDATKSDFENSYPLLRQNSYIAFHNCSPGFSQEDRYYIERDGGPWLVTEEIKSDNKFKLEAEIDRMRIFKFSGTP